MRSTIQKIFSAFILTAFSTALALAESPSPLLSERVEAAVYKSGVPDVVTIFTAKRLLAR